jgi:hypothetical protein
MGIAALEANDRHSTGAAMGGIPRSTGRRRQ